MFVRTSSHRRPLAVLIAGALFVAGTPQAATVHPALKELARGALERKASGGTAALRAGEGARAATATIGGRSLRLPISLPTHAAPAPDALGADGRIGIVAVASGSGEAAAAALRALGAVDVAVAGQVVDARIPARAVSALGAQTSIDSVAPYAPRGRTSVGTADTQGDAAVDADLARAALATAGEGVKVCVVSDSFATLAAAPGRPDVTQDIASGDLPGAGNPFARTRAVEVIQEGPARSDEGRAMLQIIHDLAPGADLGFGSWFAGGQATQVQLLDRFAARGCNVVADDTGSLNAPFFRDGIVARKIDELAARGVHYVISAGNFGRQGFTTAWRGGEFATLLNFADDSPIGDYELANLNPDPNGTPTFFQRLTPNGDIDLALQWADRHLSEGEADGARTEVDVFVALAPDPRTVIYAASGRANGSPLVFLPLELPAGRFTVVSVTEGDNVGGDPLERFRTRVFDAQNRLVLDTRSLLDLGIDLYLAVGRRASSAGNPGHVRWVETSGNLPDDAVQFRDLGNSQTIWGAANAARAISVGAARYDTVNLADATNPATVRGFSALGGAPLFYSPDGTLLPTPLVRRKPEITGPDGVDTTFFNPTGNPNADFDGTGFPNFSGTSAAAPHVAGIAALLLSATGRQPTPDTLRALLQSTARDTDDPDRAGRQTGFDFRGGTGIVDAFAAGEAITADVGSSSFDFPAGALLGNGRPYKVNSGSSIASISVSGYGIGTLDQRGEDTRFVVDPAPVTIIGSLTERNVFPRVTGTSTDRNTRSLAQTNAYVTNLGFRLPASGQVVRANQPVAIEVASHERVFRVDYSRGSTALGSSTDASAHFRITARLPAGSQTITATARDAAGTAIYTRSLALSVSP
jgi:hypothetical protein